MQGDLSVLYALMGVIIFLALMAALGAWLRGGGLKRDEAESLFSDSQERHRDEVTRLEKIIEETRLANEQAQARAEAAMTDKLRELDEHVSRTQSDLQAAVSQAAYDQGVTVSKELEVVSNRLDESDSRMNSRIAEINGTLQTVQTQVNQAGEQIRSTLIEITNQQREQKAQSTIQLCEALITSLGTLKSSISNQLVENANTSQQTVDADDLRPEISISDGEKYEPKAGGSGNGGFDASRETSSADDEMHNFDDPKISVEEDKLSIKDADQQAENQYEGLRYSNDTGGAEAGEISSEEADYNPATTTESAYSTTRGSESGSEESIDRNFKTDESGRIEADQEPDAYNWGDAAISSSEADTADAEDDENESRNI